MVRPLSYAQPVPLGFRGRRAGVVCVQAIEEAAASARAQSADRIAALQAQVLELQAGG